MQRTGSFPFSPLCLLFPTFFKWGSDKLGTRTKSESEGKMGCAEAEDRLTDADLFRGG